MKGGSRRKERESIIYLYDRDAFAAMVLEHAVSAFAFAAPTSNSLECERFVSLGGNFGTRVVHQVDFQRLVETGVQCQASQSGWGRDSVAFDSRSERSGHFVWTR